MSDTTTTTTEETSADIAPSFSVDINAATFAAAYAAVSMAASTDSTRPILGAVRLEVLADGSAELVATDSYRLHAVTIDAAMVHAAEDVRGLSVRIKAGALKATEVRRLAKPVMRRTGEVRGVIRVECARGLTSETGCYGRHVGADTVTVSAVHPGGDVDAALTVANLHTLEGPRLDSVRATITGTREEPAVNAPDGSALPALNPAYLADIGKAADIATGGGGGCTIRQIQAAALKPNAWNAASVSLGTAFVGLLMPVRDPSTVPAE